MARPSKWQLGGALSVLVAALLAVDDAAAAQVRSSSGAGAAAALQLRRQRREREHRRSLAELLGNMTLESALEAVAAGSAASAERLALIQKAIVHHQRGRSSSSGSSAAAIPVVMHARRHLRAKSPSRSLSLVGVGAHAGSVDAANKMLNGMILEVRTKYDVEFERCCDFAAAQESLLESAHQDIAGFAAEAAEARSRILAAQADVEGFKQKITSLTDGLHVHRQECADEVRQLEGQLTLLQGDVERLGQALGSTSCSTQAALLQCKDSRTGKTYTDFAHGALGPVAAQLQTREARERLLQGFHQGSGHATRRARRASREPTGHTELEYSMPLEYEFIPETGEVIGHHDDGMHSACALDSEASCTMLLEKFLLIQADIEDKRDELGESIGNKQRTCQEEARNYEAQLEDFELRQKAQQTALAAATEQMQHAQEQSRLKGIDLARLESTYKQMTQTCHTNYLAFEGEECGLKKIRGELNKMSGGNKVFQDCEVTPWIADACSASCGGGMQKLTREVEVPASNGAPCPALAKQKSCAKDACPIDCRMGDWGGWSTCSSQCGGGVRERVRDVITKSANGGEACGDISQTESCNIGACETPCELSDWSGWSACSKLCGGGHAERTRNIAETPADPESCPAWDSSARRELRRCNVHKCELQKGEKTLACNSTLDVVLLLDASGANGAAGWKAIQSFGASLASSLARGGSGPKLATITFSSPSSRSLVEKCLKNGTVDIEKDCQVKSVAHFGTDAATQAEAISKLPITSGITRLTSVALMAALTEVGASREDAPTAVVVVTGGRALSERRVHEASMRLRSKARLLWVAARPDAFVPNMPAWASAPWSENVVRAGSFKELKAAGTVNRLVSDLCPSVT